MRVRSDEDLAIQAAGWNHEGRKRREIDPTVALLRECAVALQKDTETPPEVRDRIVAQMEFFETLTDWYDSIKNLPRKTLLKMMRLGQKIANPRRSRRQRRELASRIPLAEWTRVPGALDKSQR